MGQSECIRFSRRGTTLPLTATVNIADGSTFQSCLNIKGVILKYDFNSDERTNDLYLSVKVFSLILKIDYKFGLC